MTTRYFTIVCRVPETVEQRTEVSDALTRLAPYQVAMSNEDEMTLLECIQKHEAYPDYITDEARAKAKKLAARAEAERQAA